MRINYTSENLGDYKKVKIGIQGNTLRFRTMTKILQSQNKFLKIKC